MDERKQRVRLHPSTQPLQFPGRPPGPGPAAAGLTLQRECVRCRGELMSLGVDDRSPSAADASEMTEGCREWQGLTLTAGKQGQRVSEGWRECPRLCRPAVMLPYAPIIQMRTLRHKEETAESSAPPFHRPTRHQRAGAGKGNPWPLDPMRPSPNHSEGEEAGVSRDLGDRPHKVPTTCTFPRPRTVLTASQHHFP